MSKDQPTQILAPRRTGDKVEKLEHQSQPFLILDNALHLRCQCCDMDGPIGVMDIRFTDIYFPAGLYPLLKLSYRCVRAKLPHPRLPIPSRPDVWRQTAIDLFIQSRQQHGLEWLNNHVMQDLFRAEHWLFNFSRFVIRPVNDLMRITLAGAVVWIVRTRHNMVIRCIKIQKRTHDLMAVQLPLRRFQGTTTDHIRGQHLLKQMFIGLH